jgi:chemotaxis methyl-accepting protein methylase
MTAVDPAFESLLEHIKEQRAFDFTGYKRASLARRVRRRMESVGIDGYDEYLDHLTVHPDEFTQLFNTILIKRHKLLPRHRCVEVSAERNPARDRATSGGPAHPRVERRVRIR